ncbi:hypothetical protein AAFF_G00411610 [Aldrovandia affinis]|uniref:Uncharacterized protein n=1 Tax=Aldrovandia affinis TaxID=143900 RepID=A0AAD7WKK1_9TELE|nr:hypothetical protein AAFF_G00411610 [Aldrovandia affinis]
MNLLVMETSTSPKEEARGISLNSTERQQTTKLCPIKPETKVLIIKNLKSKSPAEVADIFNVSKRQVERIRKRYQETGDVHDRPRSGKPHKTTA